MPGENLTRIEAQERRAIVETQSYDIALDLTTGDEVFASRSTVRFTATEGAATFIDLIAREVREITLNGRRIDPAAAFADSRIALDGLAADNELTIVADCEYTNTGEGLHRFVDPVDGEVYLYSQFEVPDSRRVYAVFEQPDLKATFRFTVTAPSRWKVVSNSPTPEPQLAGDGSATWSFEPTPRISSYITALVAGPYEQVFSELTSADGRVIPLGVYARKSLWQYLDADYIFEKTRQGFAYFEDKFGVPYPFEKYDQLFVPEFNAGAMENAGAVTFTETYVFRSKVTDAVKERRVVTILHELAHMWFGDLVTMKWWNDLWLNESFAEWASTIATAEATEWTEAWTTFNAMEKTWAYRQDQLPSTHPVFAAINDLEDVQVNFDGITYAKGGSVLKQLAAWVGIDAFFGGVSAYFQKHAWGNTELSDLLVELEATSGRELTSWSKKWLETAGVNTLAPEIRTDGDGVITRFAIVQTAPADYPTIRPHRLGVGFYSLDGDALVRTHHVELDVDGDLTEVPELKGHRQPDLVLLNDDDLAYAKIRLDERSLRTATAHLSSISDPLARSLVWGAAWDQTRDAEASASEYLDLVLQNIASETESTTVRTTLAQLQLAANSYVAPGSRDAARERVADGLWELAQAAEPGSDSQLQFVSAFASAAATPSQWDRVARLRSGESTLPGLDVDADLSWALLVSLAAGGVVDASDIDAALEADNTAKGGEFAAQARAALPTIDAKRAAWASLVDSADLPNTVVRSVAAGFVHPAGTAVLGEFVDAYFAMLLPVWESRTYQIAQYLIVGLYPAPLADVALRDATRRWLAEHKDAPAALRRLVNENLAGVERALSVQDRDQQD
ncbi:aminopeptidase N [Microbacterium sp. EYE_5]|uniref:aminopeptidase N n=1 Tax=unclassified Microbacterium TaxID=2609290 RepID=UPI002006277E|nr:MULTISPECIES: aminopeptidase N [unclassified Microbacterium]MCK6080807.1 aminopeptidase N [Microbacterium sp. EYE_382]MCK6086078.1 aminopeptidase N [Microbacterium sp. EYE_384]MCK6124424.1 aminopeptidase N [Microbacterium sp. EYE_80]MCK6127333.1 aminopeptidase N [Microbacterium sp. EYE_79]MCK6141762.1 aminopeptidase N [Microbacterium sp. EYE_39]